MSTAVYNKATLGDGVKVVLKDKEEYLKLAYQCAHSFLNTWPSLRYLRDSIVSEAILGLLEGYEVFDASRVDTMSVETYLYNRAKNQIFKYLERNEVRFLRLHVLQSSLPTIGEEEEPVDFFENTEGVPPIDLKHLERSLPDNLKKIYKVLIDTEAKTTEERIKLYGKRKETYYSEVNALKSFIKEELILIS